MNSNSAPMLGMNRDLDRHGYWCGRWCKWDGDDGTKNGMLRARSKRAWKKDQQDA